MAKEKSAVGRPTKLTPEVLAKLEEAFKSDFKDEEACSHAGIHPVTFYRWMNEDEEFRNKIETAKQFLFKFARNKLAKGVMDGTISPLELLDRRDRKRYAKGQVNEETVAHVFLDAEAVKKADPSAIFESLRAAGVGARIDAEKK